MKIMMCPKCNKKQSQGKFCLDCGTVLKEIITNEVKFKPMNTNKSADDCKRDIRSWLTRIGVQNPDIKIYSTGGEAIVNYRLNNKEYQFKSHLQDSITNNLGAVEQFLHYRVLGIERGIETTEQAFAGYEALPDFNSIEDPYMILGVKKEDTIDTIRSSFKNLAKKYHPDVNKNEGADKMFQRIKKAMDEIEMQKTNGE